MFRNRRLMSRDDGSELIRGARRRALVGAVRRLPSLRCGQPSPLRMLRIASVIALACRNRHSVAASTAPRGPSERPRAHRSVYSPTYRCCT